MLTTRGTASTIRRVLLDGRPSLFLSIVLTVTFGVSAYSCRAQSLLACPASGYGADTYLAYCGAGGYGDYDYGAFWFGLEPAASDAAADARVLFLGNSRMQFGLSSEATDAWFTTAGASYYLLGFAYDGNHLFAAPLLDRLRPVARVYVVNVDLFFANEERPPARAVMRDSSAPSRYQRKRYWQSVHQWGCSSAPVLCDHQPAFFRTRATGAWRLGGGEGLFTSAPVSYDDLVEEDVVSAHAVSGAQFLSTLPVDPECQILTMVPTVGTRIGTAQTLASRLGRLLIVPRLTDLTTFDGSHLDPSSAERWSRAFFEAAGPQMSACLASTAADSGSNEP